MAQGGHAAPGQAEPAAPATLPVAKAPVARRVPELAALVLFLIGEIVFFWIKSPFFMNWDNWLNILNNAAVIGIIAAPATMLLIAGQFDLSVGSGTAFVGVVMAYTVTELDWSEPLALLIAILGGIGLGALNGFLVTVVGVNALITTLGTLAAFRGLAQVIADGQTLLLGGFGELGTDRPFLDIPVPVIILVVVIVVFWFVMRYTVFGRSMYAIGANPAAARLTGIRSRRFVFIAFVLSGLMVALAGLIQVSQVGAATPTAGLGLELSVVTAVILGGASLAGGRGTVLGTALGFLIVGVLNNGLILLNVDPFWQDVARGALLIAAVSFDQLRIRLTAK
jgi:ribose transport system permease protein